MAFSCFRLQKFRLVLRVLDLGPFRGQDSEDIGDTVTKPRLRYVGLRVKGWWMEKVLAH